MGAKSISEALWEEADRLLHAQYEVDAKDVFRRFSNNQPPIDNGEWTIYCQAQIDALRDYHAEELGVPLRRIEIDIVKGEYVLLKP
ncbi:hypothetical protein GA830_10430 [Mesorhizobium sp. NBSH29]|uniref:hypothetical protein n=1 Tax=Mesorhizobium sp. NBSH29 TaxID=2654249 RepID=UPI0018968967|nr:hypothetical protein [Mesorhizobium sp. NBSH29]QPC87111.1 hypothetical protein GA830_10430 [Mesorhizobium sp. NBSH29]